MFFFINAMILPSNLVNIIQLGYLHPPEFGSKSQGQGRGRSQNRAKVFFFNYILMKINSGVPLLYIILIQFS